MLTELKTDGVWALFVKLRMLLALTSILVLTACTTFSASGSNQTGPTAPPSVGDAEGVAKSFLDAWVSNDYATMYGLLSPKSLLISQEGFSKTYSQLEQILKPGDKGKSYELMRDKTERQGTTAIIRYNMTFNSAPLGEFTDANRTMRLVITPHGWRVAWSTMDIFEGMAGGATLNLELTQSPRGVIYDRNGKVIAKDGTPNMAVRLLTRAYPGQRPQDCFYKLAETFRIRESDLEKSYLGFTGLDYGFTIGHLSKEDFDAHHAELDAVCKLQYVLQTTRFYYGGGLAPQVVGFVGSIPAEEAAKFPHYAPDALIGRQGIEQYWENQLAGDSGARLVINTSNGVQVRVVHTKDPSPSQDVTLTIDRDLQLATEQALASAFNHANWAQFSTGAAAIVLNVNTGEVLAMANFPSVDPDAYLRTTSFDSPDAQIAYDKRRALFNRATQETYALGSVFKIASMAAAANSGTFKLDQVYTDNGLWDGTKFGDQIRKDWIYLDKYSKEKNHGTLTLIQALTASCDTCFWEVGKDLYSTGKSDLLKTYANQLGLGVKTGIDAIPEVTGYIPDPDSKFKNTNVRWGIGDTLNTVVGQGDVQVTPIQVARMMVSIANGGQLYQPLLVKRVGAPEQTPSYEAKPAPPDDIKLAPEVLRGIQQGLCGVTRDEKRGTAKFIFYNWTFDQISVCGKTGTAQTGSAYPNGWFAAYAGKVGAKSDIAVVVLVERSREGSETAGPIVRRIIEAYYGLPYEPWPEFWSYPYELLPDPNVSDGGGPHPNQ